MILAAGKGNRMRPLTDVVPKPLLLVKNQPLIVYMIKALAKAGIVDIVINLGHLGHKIETYLDRGQALGVNIQYSYEDPILETAGGIKKALPLLGDRFIAVSADIFTDFDFSTLLVSHIEHAPLAHLVLSPNPIHHPIGDYGFQGSTHFLSDSVDIRVKYNFAGIGVYHAALFDDCPTGVYALGKLLKAAIANQQISGELYKGLWYNIGTPEQLEMANRIE